MSALILHLVRCDFTVRPLDFTLDAIVSRYLIPNIMDLCALNKRKFIRGGLDNDQLQRDIAAK